MIEKVNGSVHNSITGALSTYAAFTLYCYQNVTPVTEDRPEDGCQVQAQDTRRPLKTSLIQYVMYCSVT